MSSVYWDEVSFYIESVNREKLQDSYLLALSCANANSKNPSKFIRQLSNELKKYDKPRNIEIDKDTYKVNMQRLKNIFKKFDK